MKLEMLAVRDAKVEAFMQPFFAQSVGSAHRAFGDEIHNRESVLSKHPEDYALFWLGTFDCLTGQLELKSQPVQVVLGVNIPNPQLKLEG